ncbi:MAG: hypothetical protein RLZZ508_583 [Actinomycetota bacterium]
MKRYSLLVITFLLAFLPVSSASAESAWRYWSYWQLNDGVWEMAMTGAADVAAEDGQVQGWRYITAGIEIGAEFAPRTEETFETICADVPAKDGIARVALVVDFGDASDYSNEADASAVQPTKTACVEVTAGDPSSLLLSSAFETREEAGMVCGVENLPSSGCGEEVEIPAVNMEEPKTTSAPVDESREESNTYLLLGAFLVAIGGIALIVKNKKSE